MGGSCDLNGISIPLSSMWYSMQYHFLSKQIDGPKINALYNSNMLSNW